MISDEAVAAGARAIAGARFGLWELVPAPQRRVFLRDARLSLEAAAPHMLAKAWDEGCSEGLLVNNGWEAGALDANPYRSQA